MGPERFTGLETGEGAGELATEPGTLVGRSGERTVVLVDETEEARRGGVEGRVNTVLRGFVGPDAIRFLQSVFVIVGYRSTVRRRKNTHVVLCLPLGVLNFDVGCLKRRERDACAKDGHDAP